MASTKSLVINDLSSATLEIQVKITRQFYVRQWLGLRLIGLASRIMGCDLRVSDKVDMESE